MPNAYNLLCITTPFFILYIEAIFILSFPIKLRPIGIMSPTFLNRR